MIKSNKGITLLALTIIIIALLILAGVALKTVVGDNGTIEEARNMSQSAKYNNVLELIKMDILAEKNKKDTNRITSDKIENIFSKYNASCLKESVQNTDGTHTNKIKQIVLEDGAIINFDSIVTELNIEVIYSSGN